MLEFVLLIYLFHLGLQVVRFGLLLFFFLSFVSLSFFLSLFCLSFCLACDCYVQVHCVVFVLFYTPFATVLLSASGCFLFLFFSSLFMIGNESHID